VVRLNVDVARHFLQRVKIMKPVWMHGCIFFS